MDLTHCLQRMAAKRPEENQIHEVAYRAQGSCGASVIVEVTFFVSQLPGKPTVESKLQVFGTW